MKSDKKILLFLPNYRWFNKRPWEVMPLTVAVLTRIFRDNHIEVEFFDANIRNLKEDDVVEQLKSYDSDIVMITTLSIEYHMHFNKALELVKKALPDSTTILGGIYPTVLPEESLESLYCDYIYIGPAEGRISKFINALKEGEFNEARSISGVGYKNGDGQIVVNHLDHTKQLTHPVDPDYSLIDVRAYLDAETYAHYQYTLFEEPTAMLMTSYGCVYNCLFCAARTIRGRQVHFRSAKGVLKEIEWFYEEHGVRHFSVVDDLFLADKRRAVEILKEIKNRNYEITWKVSVSAWHLDDEVLELMKDTGCVLIFLFVESGNPRVLKEIIRKPLNLEILPSIASKCRELDIYTSANYVIGFPGEKWDEIRDTFRVAEELGFDYSTFCLATPFPKTDLYEICKKEDLLPEDFDFRNPKMMGLGQGFITTDEFTPTELMILRAYEWDRINFRTPERVERVAKVLNLTVEELNSHRKETRRKFGLHHHGTASKDGEKG